jgi:hypothetical protein
LWGPAPVQARDEDADDPVDGPAVEAALAAVGFETADLFALNDDGPDGDEPASDDGVQAPPKSRRRARTASATKPATRRAGRS